MKLTRPWKVLLLSSAAGFAAYLDTTIVNVAFPDIARSFPDASRSELGWVLDAYFVVLAALLVAFGRLSDAVGAKRVLLWGIAAFGLTSAACAAAPSWEALVGFRAVQGIAAAAIGPSSLAIVLPEFSAAQRATAVGAWSASAALASAIGPPVGGLVVEYADWRWIFLANVPVALLVLALGRRLFADVDPAAERPPLPDLPSASVLTLALGLLALAILEGGSWGWGDGATLACFGGAAALGTVVVVRSARHPAPILPLPLFGVRSFALGNVALLLFGVAFFALILTNVLFLTSVWRYSILEAGFAIAPAPFVAALCAGPGGRLADRFGARAVIVPGCVAYVAAVLRFRGLGPEADYVGGWLLPAVLSGIGVGLAFVTLGAAAVQDLEPRLFGIGSAIGAASRQFGAVVGTAVAVAVIGEPTAQTVLDAFDDAYLVPALGAGAAGLASLALARRREAPATAPAVAEPVPEPVG